VSGSAYETLAIIEALTIYACYGGSSLGSNPNISQKNTKWATKAKEWPTQSSPPKKYKKKTITVKNRE
jgi:hypothetical protein